MPGKGRVATEEQTLTDITESLPGIRDRFMEMSLPELKRAYRYVGRASGFVWPKFEAGTDEERDELRPVYQDIVDLYVNIRRRMDHLKEMS